MSESASKSEGAEKSQFVADLAAGDSVDGLFLVTTKELRPFKDSSKGEFLNLELTDRSGSITARVWDNAADIAAGFEVEDVVRVTGVVEEYAGALQIVATRVEAADNDSFKPEYFIAQTERDMEAMMADLNALLESISDRDLAGLVETMFSNEAFRQAYVTAPAAKRIHHSYLGGLLEHSLEVAAIVDTVCSIYGDSINRDLAVVGALLHDVGKLREYRYQRSIDYTDRGRLHGHTVIGYEMIRSAINLTPGFPEELAQELTHIILSHHGQMDWGAPVVPMTVEAGLVHYSDLLSGRVKQFEQHLAEGTGGGQGWTAFNRLLGRALYRGDR